MRSLRSFCFEEILYKSNKKTHLINATGYQEVFHEKSEAQFQLNAGAVAGGGGSTAAAATPAALEDEVMIVANEAFTRLARMNGDATVQGRLCRKDSGLLAPPLTMPGIKGAVSGAIVDVSTAARVVSF